MENNPIKTASLRRAFENGELSAAELVNAITKDTTRPWVAHMSLRTSIHADMFDAIQNAGELMATARRADHGGYSYLVLANQIADWQHRTLVQLRGPTVQGFLQAIERGPVQLLLHRQQGPAAILTGIEGDLVRKLFPSGPTVHSQKADADNALLDMQVWMKVLLSPEAMRVGPLSAPKRVCVSVVLPEERQQAFRQAGEVIRRAGGQ
jgi:hypothetical protein